MAKAFDPEIIKAEENLLIDCHFLIQELMFEKGVTRSQLAEKAGISKARLSQILGVEANPTLKSVARLVHALGESVSICRKPSTAIENTPAGWLPRPEKLEWSWEKKASPKGPTSTRVNDDLVAVLKGESALNDNHPKVLFMDSDLHLEAEAEAA
jgi:transcriptional regulator with XRE-family HTH domain